MTSGSKRRLPSRFPVGTKFVIEGRRNGAGELEVHSRHLEFPDGTLIRLPPRPSKPVSGPHRRACTATVA
jgi:hypothetical protein